MLDGVPAVPVMELANGVRNIIPMLHLTRTWNSVMAAATMRRGMALARDYAQRRKAFGALLSRQPLHIDTLARLQAETEAAFHLSFFLVELIGRDEAGDITPTEADLLRLLTSNRSVGSCEAPNSSATRPAVTCRRKSISQKRSWACT